jgi:hypothetical protein
LLPQLGEDKQNFHLLRRKTMPNMTTADRSAYFPNNIEPQRQVVACGMTDSELKLFAALHSGFDIKVEAGKTVEMFIAALRDAKYSVYINDRCAGQVSQTVLNFIDNLKLKDIRELVESCGEMEVVVDRLAAAAVLCQYCTDEETLEMLIEGSNELIEAANSGAINTAAQYRMFCELEMPLGDLGYHSDKLITAAVKIMDADMSSAIQDSLNDGLFESMERLDALLNSTSVTLASRTKIQRI